MKKRKRTEVLGIIISSEDIRKIGKIVKFSPKRADEIEKENSKNSGKKRRNRFLNPAHEEIMKLYNKIYRREKKRNVQI